MFDLIRRFRGLAIAVTVLALSAGAVFAGSVALPTAANAPVAAEETPDTGDPVEFPDAEDPDGDEGEDGEDADAPEAGTDEAADTHGTMVSEAAGMDTPEGFANHGEFVSCVAHLNRGQWGGGEPAEPVVLADLTPDACVALAEEAAAAKDAAKAERAAAREAAKAERAAAKAERAAARAAAKAAREAARGG